MLAFGHNAPFFSINPKEKGNKSRQYTHSVAPYDLSFRDVFCLLPERLMRAAVTIDLTCHHVCTTLYTTSVTFTLTVY